MNLLYDRYFFKMVQYVVVKFSYLILEQLLTVRNKSYPGAMTANIRITPTKQKLLDQISQTSLSN